MEFLTQFGETITMILAFLIFAWIMKRFAWGPVTDVLNERQKRIEQGFEEIRRKQEAAGTLERQLEERLRNIEQEARQRVQEGVAEGRRLAAEIQAQAHEDALAVAERSRRNIEVELAKARVELRDEIVTLTIKACEKLLRERLDEAEHRRLVGAFIEDLERQAQP